MTTVIDEHELELKEVLLRDLDEKGVLGKLQAQLKAAVYVALESHDSAKHFSSIVNSEFVSAVDRPSALLALGLVRNLLKTYRLDSTLTVFETEISGKILAQLPDEAALTRQIRLEAADSPECLLERCLKEKEPAKLIDSKNFKRNITVKSGPDAQGSSDIEDLDEEELKSLRSFSCQDERFTVQAEDSSVRSENSVSSRHRPIHQEPVDGIK